MKEPLVSVIIPCYNHESYVEAAIRSVIAQDYENIELIVLDDGSKDGSVEVIKALEAECQVRFVRYEFVAKKNDGVAATMNMGIAWSKGEYISSVSSDDEMKPNKISVLIGLIQGAGESVQVACGDSAFMDNDGVTVSLSDTGEVIVGEEGWSTFVSYYLRKRKDVDPFRNFFSYKTLIKGNYVPGMAMLWERNALLAAGCFTPGVAIEDWDLWLRLARNCQCVYTPEIVSRYRIHGENTSITSINKMRIGIDFILEREFEYVRREQRDITPYVARLWLANARKLYKAGYRQYLRRFFRPAVLLAAAGFVLSPMS